MGSMSALVIVGIWSQVRTVLMFLLLCFEREEGAWIDFWPGGRVG